MTDVGFAAVVGAVAVVVAAVPGYIALILQMRHKAAVGELRGDVQRIHVDINSRMDQLLNATAAASRAEGVAGEREARAADLATVARVTAETAHDV